MGEENHHLCCLFFQILPNLYVLHLLQLVVILVTITVGSASAYQAVDGGFESRLRLTFLRRRKISRCLAGVLLLLHSFTLFEQLGLK